MWSSDVSHRWMRTVSIGLLVLLSLVSTAEAGGKVSPDRGKRLYLWYCAPCHGERGDGKGFNAKNLDPRPARHADAGLMGRRTDMELYEVISGGGRAVGKSPLMPPWGETLNDAQIRSLILYIRSLCRCKGPE